MTIIKGDFSKKRVQLKKKDEEKAIPLYRFHVSLAFSDPVIWRRIEVPGNITLKQFHAVLQLCMGWSGEHNHQFYVGKVFYNASADAGGSQDYHEETAELQSLEEAMRWCFTYIYDAGDGWEHEILLEEVGRVSPGDNNPRLLDGEWAAPLEEIGSVHVYAEVLFALEHPQQEGSRELIEYHGVSDFDPYLFDKKKINEELSRLN